MNTPTNNLKLASGILVHAMLALGLGAINPESLAELERMGEEEGWAEVGRRAGISYAKDGMGLLPAYRLFIAVGREMFAPVKPEDVNTAAKPMERLTIARPTPSRAGMGLMPTMDGLPANLQDVVRDMSSAARHVLAVSGCKPLNDDCCAIFDEACAVFLAESINASR